MFSGNMYVNATVAMAVKKIEWRWSAIEMILLRRLFGTFVLFRSDSLPAATPMVASGDSSVTSAGSHVDEGSWKDDVRDHANL